MKALIKTILILAVVHITALIIFALHTSKYEVLNAFSILGLSLLIPQLGKGQENFFLSGLFLVILYVYVFLTYKKK